MEYFILLGGILSVPIIHYCSQTPKLEKSEKKPEGNPEEAKPSKNDQNLNEEALQKLKKSAEESKARQERILKNLTPEEQRMFKEYISNIINNEDQSSIGSPLACLLVLVLIIMILLAVSIIFVESSSSNKLEL